MRGPADDLGVQAEKVRHSPREAAVDMLFVETRSSEYRASLMERGHPQNDLHQGHNRRGAREHLERDL